MKRDSDPLASATRCSTALRQHHYPILASAVVLLSLADNHVWLMLHTTAAPLDESYYLTLGPLDPSLPPHLSDYGRYDRSVRDGPFTMPRTSISFAIVSSTMVTPVRVSIQCTSSGVYGLTRCAARSRIAA